MNSAAVQPKFNLATYLDWERNQPGKNEFVRGEIFAMVGARRIHGEVAGNCFALLRQHLKGGPCRAYINDMKVRVERADAMFYPDVFVTCDPRDRATELVFAHPTLVIEVLSESTASLDRGFKFVAYRQLDSLAEYCLIDPETRTVEVYRKGVDGLFTLHDFSNAQEVRFDSVDADFALVDVFEGVSPTA